MGKPPVMIRKLRKPPNFLLLCLAVGGMVLPRTALALHFPDTSDLLTDYQVATRKAGKPVDLFHRVGGDSASLHLDWQGAGGQGPGGQGPGGFSTPSLARYEQSREFDPDSFSVIAATYGNGGAWHEFTEAKADSVARKVYPGLQQQWILKGYGGEGGWLGSGVDRGRYFLVFRIQAPSAMKPVTGPLRLNRSLLAMLDTSSQWLHVPCKDIRKGTSPVCFNPGDDARLLIRIERKSPLILDIWLEEEESPALLGIHNSLESLPDDGQAEYAKDLSQMLVGEAQIFLVKLSQRLPILFTWPSWLLQDFQGGKIPPQAFMDLVHRVRPPGDSLPAFRYLEKGGLRLDVDLYFQGTLHLRAEERP